MGTRTSEVDTILFIRSVERGHSGTYTLSVQIENMVDSADISIQVVGQCRGDPPPTLPGAVAFSVSWANSLSCQESLFLHDANP